MRVGKLQESKPNQILMFHAHASHHAERIRIQITDGNQKYFSAVSRDTNVSEAVAALRFLWVKPRQQAPLSEQHC